LGYHKYIYKLQIVGGLALIPIEITADNHHIGEKTGVIYFKESIPFSDKCIAWYPTVNTIISERIDNPDYIIQQDRRGE
jgi:hypothetical protein